MAQVETEDYDSLEFGEEMTVTVGVAKEGGGWNGRKVLQVRSRKRALILSRGALWFATCRETGIPARKAVSGHEHPSR